MPAVESFLYTCQTALPTDDFVDISSFLTTLSPVKFTLDRNLINKLRGLKKLIDKLKVLKKKFLFLHFKEVKPSLVVKVYVTDKSGGQGME